MKKHEEQLSFPFADLSDPRPSNYEIFYQLSILAEEMRAVRVALQRIVELAERTADDHK